MEIELTEGHAGKTVAKTITKVFRLSFIRPFTPNTIEVFQVMSFLVRPTIRIEVWPTTFTIFGECHSIICRSNLTKVFSVVKLTIVSEGEVATVHHNRKHAVNEVGREIMFQLVIDAAESLDIGFHG